MTDLPSLALSVRQPWAWAIVHAGKDIENRKQIAISKGGMNLARIAIHASAGMTRSEYEHVRNFMAGIGVDCPRPDELVRGAIVGSVSVVDIVKKSDSPWFFGPRGLVLATAEPCDSVPCGGALGYFRWRPIDGGQPAEALPWMKAWPDDRAARSAKRPDDRQGSFL